MRNHRDSSDAAPNLLLVFTSATILGSSCVLRFILHSRRQINRTSNFQRRRRQNEAFGGAALSARFPSRVITHVRFDLTVNFRDGNGDMRRIMHICSFFCKSNWNHERPDPAATRARSRARLRFLSRLLALPHPRFLSYSSSSTLFPPFSVTAKIYSCKKVTPPHAALQRVIGLTTKRRDYIFTFASPKRSTGLFRRITFFLLAPRSSRKFSAAKYAPIIRITKFELPAVSL